jgi:hypothetical protein
MPVGKDVNPGKVVGTGVVMPVDPRGLMVVRVGEGAVDPVPILSAGVLVVYDAGAGVPIFVDVLPVVILAPGVVERPPGPDVVGTRVVPGVVVPVCGDVISVVVLIPSVVVPVWGDADPTMSTIRKIR